MLKRNLAIVASAFALGGCGNPEVLKNPTPPVSIPATPAETIDQEPAVHVPQSQCSEVKRVLSHGPSQPLPVLDRSLRVWLRDESFDGKKTVVIINENGQGRYAVDDTQHGTDSQLVFPDGMTANVAIDELQTSPQGGAVAVGALVCIPQA